jgi:hypothetical protein
MENERKNQINSMKSCKHVFVTTSLEEYNDGHRTDRCRYEYCIKCGLDSKYASLYSPLYHNELVESMYDIYNETCNKGIRINDCTCSPELAKGISDGIFNSFPNISDELLAVYFKNSLNHIKNDTPADSLTRSRIKRMHLIPCPRVMKELEKNK